MALSFLTHIFGSRNERLLKQYRKTVAQINALETSLEKLSDEALRAKTEEFKSRVANGETLDALLPEAYAVVREASKRVMKMRHFDVQMLGGISLHHGKISEMRTGEGKTLTATLPVYLNALTGNGVHVVTVNDYLASRDAQWMARLYNWLGLSVGINLPNMPRAEKQAAYRADIEGADDPKAKQAEIEARLNALRSPFRSAEKFWVEEIIDPRQTRALLCDFARLAEPVRKPGRASFSIRP